MFLILALNFVMKRPFLPRGRWITWKKCFQKTLTESFLEQFTWILDICITKSSAEEIASKSHVPVHKKLDEVVCWYYALHSFSLRVNHVAELSMDFTLSKLKKNIIFADWAIKWKLKFNISSLYANPRGQIIRFQFLTLWDETTSSTI